MTVETKLNLEMHRISKGEQNFTNYSKIIDQIELKNKNVENLIDEMRKMF